ncbi:hypothetical protein WJX72_000467 [[Myrmecia] bisecta]|uniref:Adenine DNA glycosylase n=1 Tax=[Myrmecia] bisecta TaxID=41462 RepID=A0AAW1PJB6_9CHLO
MSAKCRSLSKKQKVESVEGSSVQAVVLPKVDETASFTSEEVVQIRRNLLDWYDRNHRILPWRRNKHSKREASARDGEGNPGAPLDLPDQQFIYYVWVCEVMSQQTQVPRAAAYFKRWIAKWPTVQALAAASQDEVNEVWAGLGYYRRARFLLEGAQYIQRDLGGAFPTTSQELQKIPGVGAYTGNAMASIACNQPVAVVDANVVRVLARLRRLSADPRSGASVKLHALLANALVDPDRPGDFNQAMMELGATVCTVHQPPTCQDCPIRNQCQAVAVVEQFVSDGGDRAAPRAPTVVQYPSKVEKAQRREELVAVCVVELKPASGKAGVPSQYLLVQRPETGLLAGLWEFPSRAVDAGSTAKQCSQALDMYLHETLGLPIKGEM